MIKYRKATITDFQLAFDIKSNSIKPYIEEIWGWDDEVQLKFHRLDFNPDNMSFILDDDNMEVGLIDVLENDGTVFVKSILISKNAQRHGLGTAAMTDIIERSVLINKPIELQVFKINIKALTFYKKLGFKMKGDTELHHQMIRNI
ncbi:GNAT family N-acetyltransferase [Pedobacter sp. UBA5917]|jgi:ribosomal protein S18 acetylase RimI-like enzyme|uniref:GNAT family N-acetyltransferase n=1 Tax=Pedobacter sp. UBA5917 TaxID=1947061 RepID=UPI0025D13BC9|nr:GNAT family N-acetyltransferase [Pedobacter sp. UBA5917]